MHTSTIQNDNIGRRVGTMSLVDSPRDVFWGSFDDKSNQKAISGYPLNIIQSMILLRGCFVALSHD